MVQADEARDVIGGEAIPTDGELARRVARGDREAAGQLVDRHQVAVRSFLLRITHRHDLADDLAQETFVRLLQHAGRYDEAYPMRTWLFTIARRLYLNRAALADEKASRMGGHAPEHSGLNSPRRADGDDPAQLVAKHDERSRLRSVLQHAINQLTDAQRWAVALFHQQGLSLTQTAKVMSMPEGTVKSHLHRARLALRNSLTGQIEDTTP